MLTNARRTVVLCLFFAAAMPVFGADPLQVKTLFRTGIYSDSVGSAGLVARDVTGDGIADAISCSAGSAFVVAKSGAGLAPVWFSDARGCMSVTAGDTDGDGHDDVIVGGYTTAGTIAVFDPRSFGPPRVEIRLPSGGAMDLAIGDVDHDGKPEIAAITLTDLYVFDAKTLALEWTAAGKGGGRKVFIADLEGDGQNEIVASSGHVLDGATRTEKWGYVGGFGYASAVGDVDGDGKAEIVFQSGSATATIIDGDTLATRTVNLTSPVDAIGIGDAQNDGSQEILAGDNQWGAVRGIRASDGAVLWSINNPEHGVSAITVGDVTGDGARDVLWGAGLTSSGRDVLFAGAPGKPGSITWNSTDLDANFGAVVADLDSDGKLELVVKTEQSESGYSGGAVQIFDLQTRELKRTLARTGVTSSMRIQRIAVGQLDADPALEIALLGPSYYDPYLTVFDGVTGAQEYTTPYTGYGSPSLWYPALAIANVDADAVDEILVGTSDSHLEALNGATSFVQWSSGVLDGQIRDCAVFDVNNDGVKEVVVGTTAGFYVLNAATGAELLHAAISGGVLRVAATNGRFAVAASSGALALYSGALTPVWNCSGSQAAYALAFTTIGGQARLVSGDANGLLRLYATDGASCPVPDLQSLGSDWITDLSSVDVNGDAKPELVVSRNYSVDVDSLAWNRCDGAACPAMALAFTTTDAMGTTFTGTATGPAAIASVRYQTNGATVASGAGTITGSNWSAGPIQLARGTTTITVTVLDASDNPAINTYSVVSGSYSPLLPPVDAPPPRRRAGP